MRCRCCDRLLNEWESRARDPKNRANFLDLCSKCRRLSNPYFFSDEVKEEVKKEDIHIDNG